MKVKLKVKVLLLAVILSWGSVVQAQNQEGQPGNSLSKLMTMLSQMTDEQKAYARENWLVAPEVYANSHDHPSSYIISPNPVPDTQTSCECSGCSSAYLLRFYGEQANGVELFNRESFPCKHSEGAYPKCFKVLFEDQIGGYTTEYYTGTTDDLKNAVSQGIPVIVLLFNGKTLHYVPVVGYDKTHFYIQDSVDEYRNVDDGVKFNRQVEIAAFDKMWNIPIESCQRLFVVVRKDNALSRDKKIRAKVVKALTARYYRTPYDTNYVVRPEGQWTLKVRLNQTGNTFHAKGTINDIYSKADLKTSHKTTVSIGASFRGVSAALAINPAKMSGAYKDYEFNLNYYSSRLSLDASYQRSSTLSGDIERGGNMERLDEGDVTLKVLNLAGYYAFNHRRFSFPAAFTQSYIQRRSAGSWLVGFSYQGGSIETTDELKAKNDKAPDVRIYIGHFGIGGGYGYNLVLGTKWLLHISTLPTVVVYNRNNFTLNDERIRAKHMRFNMIFNERVAIVRNFSPRFFAGATLVMNNSVFDDDVVIVNQNKWRARAFVGMRL